MHDGLIQLIAGALFESQSAKERLSSDPKSAVEKLAVVQRLLGQIEGEVRRTIHNLHPPYLDQAGLIQAVQKCANSFQEMWGIPCSVQIRGDPRRLPPHAEVAIYRIVQEALVNVGTHSGAQQAYVTLDYGSVALKVVVQDNGRGFDWRKALANPGKHLGLIGMKERAESLGGRLEVRSSPGQGTTLLIEVPMDQTGGDVRGEGG
jgi:signal transduction histidine kinase